MIKQAFVDLWAGLVFAVRHPIQTAHGLCDEAAKVWR